MNVTRTMAIGILCVGLGSAMAAPPSPPAGEGPEVAELREAMQRFFETRVRAELNLSDEQFDALMPVVRELEDARFELRRQRMRSLRGLQRGLRDGSNDDALQRQLDEFEGIGDELRRLEDEMRPRIDEVLTVRQRIQFRFFSERFRNELERRVRRVREGAAGERRRGAPRERDDPGR